MVLWPCLHLGLRSTVIGVSGKCQPSANSGSETIKVHAAAARVLHLEDDDADAELVARHLAKDGFEARIDRVDTEAGFRASLAALRPDLILADFRLPFFDGAAALAVARVEAPEVPFVFVSGTIGDERAIESLKQGAADYVLKDRLARLVPVVRRALLDAAARSERVRLAAEIAERMKELTCLYTVTREALADLPTEELVERTVMALVPAMQFPELAVTSVEVDGERLSSEAADDAGHPCLSAQIRVGGAERGRVEVYYRGDRPFLLPEEQNLITAVADSLALSIERREAHATLREANDALRALFDASPVALLTLDTEARVTMWTDAAERMFGWTEEEVLGHPMPFVDPADPSHLGLIEQLLNGVPCRGVELTRVRKDGNAIHLILNAAPVRGPDGRITGIIAMEVDITGRKRSEEDLRHSIETLRTTDRARREALTLLDTLQATAPVGLGFVDLELQPVRMNDRLLEMVGPAVRAGSGAPGAEIVPSLWDQIAPALRQVRETGEPVVNAEVEGKTLADPDRTHYWLASYYPVRIEKDVIGVGVVVVDVTDQRLADEARAHLAAIVESSDDAILSETLDGTVLTWNAGATALYGFDESEMVGQPVARLIPPGAQEEAVETLGRVARGDSVRNLETVRFREDGSTVPVSLSASPVRSGNSVIAASVIAHDITERKRLEAQVRAALEQAQAASRLKSRFIASTTHEIMTPITVVRGIHELLLETDLDGMQHLLVDKVRAAGAKLETVMRDMLDFSALAEARIALEIGDFAVGPLVAEVGDSVADAAATKGLELICGCDTDVPAVIRGDRERLLQVLSILASNAVKFTDRGRVSIDARRSQDGDTLGLRLTVTDTGVGIAAADQRRVFQPYWQVDMSDTRRHGGTGIGLALVAELVDAMGGTFGVQSRPGAGSIFWVEIPSGLADGTAPQPLAAA